MTLYTGARSRVVNGGENLGRLTFFEAVRYASSAPLKGEVVLLTNADIRVEAGFRARIFFFDMHPAECRGGCGDQKVADDGNLS